MSATSVAITLAGVDVTTRIRKGSMVIRDVINDAPNTCTFVMDGSPAPSEGQALRVSINSISPRLLFNGSLEAPSRSYEGKAANLVYTCRAIDDTFRANRRIPIRQYDSVSAATIATALVADFATGFTSTNVEAALPAVSIKFDGSEGGFNGCLRALAKLVGGYFYWDDGDLHFFTAEASDLPDTVNSTNRPLDDPPIEATRDLSQVRTRVYGVGYGSEAATNIAAGDTVIPVGDTGFYNASGGSVKVDAQVITYTGLRDDEVHSPTWTSRTIPNHTWSSVAWSPALALFVAVGASAVATSPDGITWTDRSAAAAMTWNHVVWAPGISLFVAVASGAVAAQQVMTSPDGITWTSRTAAAAQNWRQVAWSPSLNLLVAVSTDGATNRVMTSPDGTTWTGRVAASASTWWAVAWSPYLSLFVALSTAGAAMSSTDGTNWTTRTAAAANQWVSVAWSPELTLFAAVSADGASRVMTSPDGVNWTSRTAAAANTWWAITWSPQQRLFVAFSIDGTSRLMYSANGTAWTSETSAIAGVLTVAGITWSPALSRYVVVTNGLACQTNDTAVRVTLLTGIPATGTGAVLYPINDGDPLNIWVQRDDAAAQAAMVTLEGSGDGIYEHLIVDQRRAQASLEALCVADLAQFSGPFVTVQYATRDVKTKSGKPVTISIAAPAISETLTIQSVTIDQIDIAAGLAPRFTATASSVRFSVEDVLRRMASQLNGL